MSVINQMLKDLQQGQGEQKLDTGLLGETVSVKQPVKKTLVLVVIVTVIITLLSVFIWQLYDENQQLKGVSQQQVLAISSRQPLKTAEKDHFSQNVDDQQSLITATSHEHNIAQNNAEEINLPRQNNVVTEQSTEQNTESSVSAKPAARQALQPIATKVNNFDNELVKNKMNNVENAKTVVNSANNITTLVTNNHATAVSKSQLTVSRRQISPQMLVSQKMAQAEEAVANNHIQKAEQLFEEVLLIMPSQHDARKQLAALWFGRQSYQAAQNLLSQGIHLESSNLDLRLLQARIYSKREQHLQAFQILQALPGIEQLSHIEYQSLLATEAQKAKQYAFAIKAYQGLTKVQGNTGRWWLGLAIAYDSDSQFVMASQAYKQALVLHDLSTSAIAFVKQRLQELGE